LHDSGATWRRREWRDPLNKTTGKFVKEDEQKGMFSRRKTEPFYSALSRSVEAINAKAMSGGSGLHHRLEGFDLM
jgi:hypothetical protein